MNRRDFLGSVLVALAAIIFPWKMIKPKPNFDKFAFPLIRQTMPRITAEDLVKVQPMNPSSVTFFMDYRFGLEESNERHSV